MSSVRSKKTREPFPRFLLSTGVGAALAGAGIVPAHATCSTAGTTVTCSGVANPLAPSYSNSANNLNATVNPGASVGVLLGVGGTAMSLTGNNTTLTNNGTIDPSALGSGLGVLSSGAVVGNAAASTATVTNNGTINGSTGVAISGVTGMALSVQNGTGGTSTIKNTGTIGSNPLVGATLSGADAPVVAAYGGGQVNFTNSGTINGRVSLESNGTPGRGNTFINSGMINGSVSMGANSTNTFTAVTGSAVNAAGGTGGAFNISVGPRTLNYAATGVVDGGAGGDNTLVLQQGAPANGTIAVNNYINFNHLNVESGNWTINGASTAQDATLSGGTAIIGDNASLGTGTVTGNGGALQAGAGVLNVANEITLATNGLTVQGTNDLTLSGVLTGDGALRKTDAGTLRLTNANTYTGGTYLGGGALVVGDNRALGTGTLTVGGSAMLDAATSMTVANAISLGAGTTLTLNGTNSLTLAGVIEGSGGLVKNGTATVTLTKANTYTGETTINDGTLAIGVGGSLASTNTVNLTGAGAAFDISAASAQTIGALAGSAGTSVILGGNTLTLSGSGNTTYAGTIMGTGGLTITGAGIKSLTGTNTYSGGTNLSSGALIVSANGALGTGRLTVSGSSTLDTATNVTLANAVSLGTGATLTLGGGTDLILGGVIEGDGRLVKNGTGTTTLTKANTFAGGTTINAGTLAIGAGGRLASAGSVSLASIGATLDLSNAGGAQTIGALSGIAGSIVNLGVNALTLGGSSNATYAGSIVGTGGLTITGTGNQVLTGANNLYSGATNLNSGGLVVGSNTALGTGALNVGGPAMLDASASVTLANAVNLATGTALTLGGSNNLTLGGAIGGNGGLVKSGAAKTTLTGVNTYTGTTTINSGTLALSGAGSLAAGTSAALTGASAVLDMSAGASQSIAHLSGVAGSQVALGANTLTLTDSTSQTFSGSLTGSGALIKQGTGTLTLNGASSAFTGTTTVAGGTLAVGDAANASATLGGNVLVSAPGTLRGHGTVSGNVSSSGLVAPGGSIGTLTVGGNYAQAATGTLAIEVSPTQASQLRVGGSAALAGTLAIVFTPGTYTARQYTLLSAANGVTGRFANVTSSTAGANLGALRSSVTYGASEVGLSLEGTAPVADPLVVAPRNTSIYTAIGTTALLQAQGANTTLLERLANVQEGPARSTDAWVKVNGTRNKVGGTGNTPGFQTHAYGFLAGADGQFGRATVGAAGGYTHTSLGEDGTGSSGDIDTLRLALYGNQPVGAVNLSATLGYGLDFFSQKRPFGSVGTAEGDHIGHEFTAATQASLPVQVGGFVLTPQAGLRFAYVRANGFGENGANGQNLQVGADNARSLQPYVGVTLDKALGDAVRPVNVQFRLGYAREVLSGGRVVMVQSQDGTMFAAPGTDLPRSFLTTGASVSLQASKATAVSLGLDALINTGHVSAQSAYVRVNHRF